MNFDEIAKFTMDQKFLHEWSRTSNLIKRQPFRLISVRPDYGSNDSQLLETVWPFCPW